ncbi:MAG: hypothetical protein NPIRA05_13570 [Nitrospirales bacterium]|nr:MAG: hypothetical protein NPIRA05_13570 [Nitrospirales bacterium]
MIYHSVKYGVVILLGCLVFSGCGLLAPVLGPVYQTSTSNVDQGKDQGFIRFANLAGDEMIYVDGNSVGTGEKFTPDALLALSPGTHTVEITHHNSSVYNRKVFIGTGSTKTIELP